MGLHILSVEFTKRSNWNVADNFKLWTKLMPWLNIANTSQNQNCRAYVKLNGTINPYHHLLSIRSL